MELTRGRGPFPTIIFRILMVYRYRNLRHKLHVVLLSLYKHHSFLNPLGWLASWRSGTHSITSLPFFLKFLFFLLISSFSNHG